MQGVPADKARRTSELPLDLTMCPADMFQQIILSIKHLPASLGRAVV